MVSIVIPNYNKEQFLPATLDSLIHQTYPHWEAVVIDDQSTDASQAILREYNELDSRINIYSNIGTTKGAAVCRNLGLRYASGQYIVFLDSDDILAPHCLQNRLALLENDPDLDFVVFPLETFRKHIGEKIHVWDPGKIRNHLLAFLQHKLCWQTMCPMWRKEFLEKLGGFDERYKRYDDVEFHTRALLYPSVKYLAPRNVKPDCYYFIGTDRMTFNYEVILDRLFNDTELFIRSISDILKRQNMFYKPYSTYLKGTVFVFMKHMFIYHNCNYINSNVKEFYYNKLISSPDILHFLTRSDLFFLSLYKKGMEITHGKIRGYNYICKKIFIHIV